MDLCEPVKTNRAGVHWCDSLLDDAGARSGWNGLASVFLQRSQANFAFPAMLLLDCPSHRGDGGKHDLQSLLSHDTIGLSSSNPSNRSVVRRKNGMLNVTLVKI